MGHQIVLTGDRTDRPSGVSQRLMKRAIRHTLELEGVDVKVEIHVKLVDDEEIRQMNAQFRDKDKPTDVLSFPASDYIPGQFVADGRDVHPRTGRLYLGDIVLSTERAAAQAVEYGHTMRREICYLLIHSVLHLLGYDHMDETDKQAMRQREQIVMERLRLG